MAWSLHILGTNAAVPVSNRYPSAQALHCGKQIFLIDCGEGTQSRLSQFGIKRSKINHVFISHLHGDHIFGLPGLITSYNLFRRADPIHVYGPYGIKAFIEGFIKATAMQLHFALEVHEHLVQTQTILDLDDVLVKTIPLKHRIPCTGYLFKEKVNARRIHKEAVHKFNVPVKQMKNLQAGQDFIKPDGTSVPNALLTKAGRAPHAYAYCSDTSFNPAMLDMIEGIDLLYHEATFGAELQDKATSRGHSTASEAAHIAKMANVKNLLIGHFSSRYTDPEILGDEARKHFRRTLVAKEGMVLSFDDIAG